MSIFTSLFLISCDNKVNFSTDEVSENVPFVTPPPQQGPSLELPPDPVVIPTPPVYEKQSGSCSTSGTHLLSCSSCQSIAPIVPPALSKKAKELIEIMYLSCQQPSFAKGKLNYVPPTREEIFNKLDNCTPNLYQESAFVRNQSEVIQRLLDPSDNWMRKKMFNALWYQPPYSTGFETYFGITPGEAAQVFCDRMDDLSFGNVINPSDWYSESVEWKKYYLIADQVYVPQLRSCFQKSLNNPYVPPNPIPGKTCSYESISGPAENDLFLAVASWLADGRSVSIESKTFNICKSINSLSDILEIAGELTASSVSCKTTN